MLNILTNPVYLAKASRTAHLLANLIGIQKNNVRNLMDEALRSKEPVHYEDAHFPGK